MFIMMRSCNIMIKAPCYEKYIGFFSIRWAIQSVAWSSSSTKMKSEYKIAIVGCGPSGCYTAKYIRSSFTKKYNAITHIDVLERLPVPYGLVRYGVAPDHPTVKNVQNDFDQLFGKESDVHNSSVINTMSFYGNVHVGIDITISELRSMYDIVVLAYGCESDRKLEIQGEDSLNGILSAREFVAWYNGHPDYVHIGQKVAKAIGYDIDKTENTDLPSNSTSNAYHDIPVVVIGQGNVALDCARVLSKGFNDLYETDITSDAIQILQNGVSDISVIGRRGHVQGAFTIKELRELTKLTDTHLMVQMKELELGLTSSSQNELSEGPHSKAKKRIDTLLHQVASELPSPGSRKRINLRFLLNPIQFVSSDKDPDSVGAIICERTILEGNPGHQRAVSAGIQYRIPAQLVLVSIGYKAILVPGLEEWFDSASGRVNNIRGRIEVALSTPTRAGLYVVGWLKRGPTGIIGTNIVDSKETIATILQDIDDEKLAINALPSTSLSSILKDRGIRYVDWDGYQRIQKYEQNVKRCESQPREKITSIDEMLLVAGVPE